ncbi:MAG: hypothetical protein K0Q60_2464 [Microvirga sp.]|jgi:hypothetical protein|nr:hypothetical protein [Microvirga sp.]
MLSATFAGWAQCRLATDPDPYDEPRGVSGYMRAYAGEPDLDRVVHFQDPPFRRTHTPEIGIAVRSVCLHGTEDSAHPLRGAAVHLLDGPKFEGRNGVIAEDGSEPIVPFHLCLKQGSRQLSRATMPSDPRSPYREFNATNFIVDPGFIECATNIPSLVDVWRNRLSLLESEHAGASPDERPALEERTAFLRQNLARQGGVAGFFPVRMVWDYQLRSPVGRRDAGMAELLPNFTPTEEPWRVAFWFGGWDADAQAFFVGGTLEIREVNEVPLAPLIKRPERMTDIV